MKKEYTFEELLHKAASYSSISEHAVSDVNEKLEQWGATEENKEKIIKHLIKENFIDENRFAQAFVKDKFRFNKWGKIKIILALKSKGVNKTLINEAINSIDDEEYETMLITILKAKLKTLKYKDEYEKQGKLFRFAQSKGFENNIIEKALQNL